MMAYLERVSTGHGQDPFSSRVERSMRQVMLPLSFSLSFLQFPLPTVKDVEKKKGKKGYVSARGILGLIHLH